MTKALKLKDAIFTQGVLAASNYFGCKDVYVCPLCKKGFERSSLESGLLTLEHVPPKSIGGKGIILTCKTCNNTAGHNLESHISQRDKLDHFIKVLTQKCKGLAGHAVLKINNTPINVELRRDKSTIDIIFLKDSNDPVSIQSTTKYMENLALEGKSIGTEFILTPKISYHNRLIRVGELRCAFLACTATFGYNFAFDPILDQVREQINNPHKASLPQWWLTNPTKTPPLPILVSESNGFVLVNYCNQSTILPWPSRQDDNVWKIAKLFGEGKSIKLSTRPYPWPQFFDALLDVRNK